MSKMGTVVFSEEIDLEEVSSSNSLGDGRKFILKFNHKYLKDFQRAFLNLGNWTCPPGRLIPGKKYILTIKEIA